MNWQNLWVGLSLLLVVEGFLPFISPGRYRKMLEVASGIRDDRLRIGGAFCMGAGILLLYIVN